MSGSNYDLHSKDVVPNCMFPSTFSQRVIAFSSESPCGPPLGKPYSLPCSRPVSGKLSADHVNVCRP